MNEQRLYSVLLGPRSTEKSENLAEKNSQITFKVKPDATKLEIKQAIEKLFSVKVSAVRTANVNGKVKRFRNSTGKRKNWKKALVSLQDGYDINVAEFE